MVFLRSEIRQLFTDRRLASTTRHPGWVKNNYPGLGDLYVPRRVGAVLERFKPMGPPDDDVLNKLNNYRLAPVGSCERIY